MKVILDCDCTFGLHQCDIDDGLAIAHLLRVPEVDLLGVTLTYGNASIDEVIRCTKDLKRRLNWRFKIISGNNKKAEDNPAARYLVKMVKQLPNQIIIVATGSQSNIAAAVELDPMFLNYVKDLYIMGGDLTGCMKINGIPVDELNLSVNYQAAYKVLMRSRKPTLVSGSYINNVVTTYRPTHVNWVDQAILNWQTLNFKKLKINGFINWDGITVNCLTNADLFMWAEYHVELSKSLLKKGTIKLGDVNDPVIKTIIGVKNMSSLQESVQADIKFLSQCIND